jgi:hypothetical protein
MINFIRLKISETCVKKRSPAGYLVIDWTVGTSVNKISGLCRTQFMHCYSVSNNCTERLCFEIKQGVVASSTVFGDRTSVGVGNDKKRFINMIVEKCKLRNIILDKETIAMMSIPNSEMSVNCYTWFKLYFKLIGDCEPNTDGEIHLEPCSVTDIYAEYRHDQRISGKPFFQFTQYAAMWRNCFP